MASNIKSFVIAQTLNKQSYSKNIKQIVKEVLKKSTIHGISNIIENENIIIKSLWIIFFLIFNVLCYLMCYKSVMEYLKYEVEKFLNYLYFYSFLFVYFFMFKGCVKSKCVV